MALGFYSSVVVKLPLFSKPQLLVGSWTGSTTPALMKSGNVVTFKFQGN